MLKQGGQVYFFNKLYTRLLFWIGLLLLTIFVPDIKYTLVAGIFIYALLLSSLALSDTPRHTWLIPSDTRRITNATTQNIIRGSQALAILSGLGFLIEAWDTINGAGLTLRVSLRALALLYVLWLVACGEGTPPKHGDALLCISTTAFWLIAASSSPGSPGNMYLWYPAIHSLSVDVGIYTVLLLHAE